MMYDLEMIRFELIDWLMENGDSDLYDEVDSLLEDIEKFEEVGEIWIEEKELIEDIEDLYERL